MLHHHHHHFWQAPLRVRSAERRHQSPEWMVLRQVNCIVHIEVAFRSCWMVFIHVIRGRPSGLLQFPAGEAVKICFASVSSGIRAMCPNRDRRLDWTMAERWGCLVNLLILTLSLRTCCCQLIPFSFLLVHVLKMSSFSTKASGGRWRDPANSIFSNTRPRAAH